MGWGNPFTAAWDAATDAAKAGAEKVASGAQWVGQKSADAAAYAKQKAQEAAAYAKQKAQEAAAYAKQKALDAAAYAKQKAAEAAAYAKAQAEKLRQAAVLKARDLERAAANKIVDGVGAVGEAKRKTSDAISSNYKKVKRIFTADDAGTPVKSCPGLSNDSMTHKQRDGWLMAPQGPGKPCITIPPGPGAAKAAREKSKLAMNSCCKEKRAPGQKERQITYVNGIKTKSETHCDTLNAIAEQTCGRVIGVYNATEGFLSDGAETGQDRRLIKAAEAGKSIPSGDGRNPAVDSLHDATIESLRDGIEPEIWAHSQGGAVTSLAMYGVKNYQTVATGNPNPLGGIKIKSFGSAAPSWTDGPSYEHYVHVNDLTPSTLGLGHTGGGDATNAGAGAKVVRFSGDPNSSAPFSENPNLNTFPSLSSNHGINESVDKKGEVAPNTYLRMEKQRNGGCP